jgi:beta-glucanase (GH16 family)
MCVGEVMVRQWICGVAALVMVVGLPRVAGAALLLPVLQPARNVPMPPVNTVGTATPGTVVFRDDFSGSALDTSKWMVGTWSMQRTRYGNTPGVANGLATLRLDTYNAQAPGTAMRGTEILSRQVYPRGTGLEFSARLRFRSMPNGLVMGFYTWAPEPGMASTSDEMDFEFLSNWNNQNQAGGDRVLMSTYNDWNYATSRFFDGVHHSDARPPISGLDLEKFNTFTIRWLPQRTEWLVNGVKVHSTSQALADEAMPIKLNFWAPNTVWGDAYSAGLMPTGDPGANRSFYYDVDWAEVKAIGSGLSGEAPSMVNGPAVPEPGVAGMMAVAAVVMATWRRRG